VTALAVDELAQRRPRKFHYRIWGYRDRGHRHILPTVAVAASVPVAAVIITWADGTATAVHPPETPARPANATPAYWPRGLPGGRRVSTA
jgi:hypothetical protein